MIVKWCTTDNETNNTTYVYKYRFLTNHIKMRELLFEFFISIVSNQFEINNFLRLNTVYYNVSSSPVEMDRFVDMRNKLRLNNMRHLLCNYVIVREFIFVLSV